MNNVWFKGKSGIPSRSTPAKIESMNREALFGVGHYEADDDLVQATNTALQLDMPLLLSGEPGTGKTQLAEKLAQELGMNLFRFETKSTSAATDLFYSFDHVRRFQAAHSASQSSDLSPLRFVEYGPLGKAILQGIPEDKAAEWFYGKHVPAWRRDREPSRAIVLVDEIDKASMDFSNDALNEIERHYFRIRELDGIELRANPEFRPILVITSNSERQLPDAFMRRCLFHYLRPMSREKLQRVVHARLAELDRGLTSGKLLDDALDLFFALRDDGDSWDRKHGRFNLLKPPSTAEFLAFVGGLALSGADPLKPLEPKVAKSLISTLIKSHDDLQISQQHPLLR